MNSQAPEPFKLGDDIIDIPESETEETLDPPAHIPGLQPPENAFAQQFRDQWLVLVTKNNALMQELAFKGIGMNDAEVSRMRFNVLLDYLLGEGTSDREEYELAFHTTMHGVLSGAKENADRMLLQQGVNPQGQTLHVVGDK